MMMLFKIISYYKIANLLAIFNIKKNSPLYYAGKSLSQITYRLPNESKKDVFITLRIYKRIFINLFKGKNVFLKLNQNTYTAIFDGNHHAFELRDRYIKKYSGEDCSAIISKDDLICFLSIYLTIFYVFILISSFIPVFLISLFSKNKFHFPLMIQEFFETVQLVYLVKTHHISKIHYFCIYERDSNICAFILMKLGIYINKIPSEVPLYFFNKTIIANELSFCFAYQQEEFEEFKKTMFVEKTNLWAPEQILNAPKRFLTIRENEKNSTYDIGFFSSGNWLRAQIGDVDMGHNDKDNEELILRGLIDYAQQNNLKLVLFLHPLEKRAEHKVASEVYYKEFLQHNNVSLADTMISSIEGFDDINIGVSLYSTLMFERIYLGFKTILAPFDYDDFPIKQSSLNQICVHNIQQLYAKLDVNLKLTTIDFFETNHLKNYSLLLH
jgi:hypothetical protein